VDDVARPCGAKTLAVEGLMDAQILTEAAIQAVRRREIERGIQCMEMALLYYKDATAKIEEVRSERANH